MNSVESWQGEFVRIRTTRVRWRQEDTQQRLKGLREGAAEDGPRPSEVSRRSHLPTAAKNSDSGLESPNEIGAIAITLERLSRWNLGGPPAPSSSSSSKKKSHRERQDKSDKLRVLTEKLKSSQPAGATSATSATVSTAVDDSFDLKLELPKPESRSIVGSYIQRTIPFRSASFSQVDYSPSGGKSSLAAARNSALAKKAGLTSSLPQRKNRVQDTDVPNLQENTNPPNSDHSEPYQNHKSRPRKLLRNHSVDHDSVSSKDSLLEEVEEETRNDSTNGDSKQKETQQTPSRLSDKHFSAEVASKSDSEECVKQKGKKENKSDPRVLQSKKHALSVEESPLNRRNGSSPRRWGSDPDKTKSDSRNNKFGENRSWSVSECVRKLSEWASGAQDDQHSPDDLGVKFSWPKLGDRKSAERPKLVCQSSEERDDDRGSTRNRFHGLIRTDSLSEGESDTGYKGSTSSRGSPSLFAASDQSDCECRHSRLTRSPHPPKRYSKRPLRGPYGQMLEAEMKKPETKKFIINHDDLKFLEESESGKGGSKRAMDDSHLKRCYTANENTDKASPKRKISSGLPYPDIATKPEVYHQRTTSSPSQLEGCSKEKTLQPSQQLLAQLLKGSSERSLSEANPVQQLFNSPSYWKDTRTHIAVELYDTERSYVESLQILVMKYLQPLKNPETTCLPESSIVDEIFYKVPEILAHHEIFLEELRKRLENWDFNQKVGDLFLETFTKQSVIDTYSGFINNWKNAKEAIKTASQSKQAFARFLEAMAREHKGKLALDSLLIMPVQRIPRYELLIQTLLKHTSPNHSDGAALLEALQVIHDLAVTINLGQHRTLNPKSSNCQELSQMESIIEGLDSLSSPDRTFLSHEQVCITTSTGKKDRALFLFSDLLVITSIKRRSGTIKKLPAVPGNVVNTLEGNKFKLLMKIPLRNLEIVKAKDDNVRKMLKEMEQLNSDVSTLSQMAELVTTLHCPHSQLEENIRDMLSALNKQLAERHAADSQLSYLELVINTQNGQENIALLFTKPEKRTSWEETFNDAKQRLALTGEKRALPELVAAVPIRKTRAGLQITCAAPTTCGPGPRDVWVCNSDGYVGQVCVFSLQPEPTVTSCNGVCNARILCIAPVPGYSPNQSESFVTCDSGISISVEDTDYQERAIHLESSSSSSDDDDKEDESTESVQEDLIAGTMWLGTEDGCIHVYNCNNNIRTKKNKLKIQHCAPVHTIIYLDNRVFVALANGDICIYSRDSAGNWKTNDAITVTVGSSSEPISKMMPINGRLWCACQSTIIILNISSFTIEHNFVVCAESNRYITSIAVSGLSVWISLHNSATVRLFHATTFENLGEVSVASAVTKMLASCDDIIRQHKAACLRVTSLLACKDLLWIGTSAGVVLTMTLPHVTPTTTKLNSTFNVAGVPHGHTGHVRFLTTVELLPPTNENKRKTSVNSKQKCPKLLVISGGDGYEDFRSVGIAEVAGREDSTNHLLMWQV